MNNLNERVLKETNYILKTNKTVREVASEFNVSKSTVHKDLQERLPKINQELFSKVQDLMQQHIEERHLRGGESTKNKYKKLK
ncbi:MAG: sporulation transcriptional regulator SpoIIID [Bacilli bacterium]|nr:sporulation transcriptional regulator SpoIIID [Bacilli bacterium]